MKYKFKVLLIAPLLAALLFGKAIAGGADSVPVYKAEFIIESPGYSNFKAVILNLSRKYDAQILKSAESDHFTPSSDEIKISLNKENALMFIEDIGKEFNDFIKEGNVVNNGPDSLIKRFYVIIYWKKSSETTKVGNSHKNKAREGSTYILENDGMYITEEPVEKARKIILTKPGQEERALEGEKFEINYSGAGKENIRLRMQETKDGLFVKIKAEPK